MEHLILEELDRDGALRETAAEAAASVGDSRADFLRKAGLGAGAVVGGGAFVGAFPAIASAAVPKSDIAILNFALTLEYLEAQFYADAVSRGKLTGETELFARTVAAHESAHVAFLKSALGAKAVKKPGFNFRNTTTDQATFEATAQTLEDTGVEAYLGQVGNIKSKAILKAAGSILPVEARHAAWIRDIRLRKSTGILPAPSSFQGARTKAQILAKVKATNFIVS
jgi:hypothetical protein